MVGNSGRSNPRRIENVTTPEMSVSGCAPPVSGWLAGAVAGRPQKISSPPGGRYSCAARWRRAPTGRVGAGAGACGSWACARCLSLSLRFGTPGTLRFWRAFTPGGPFVARAGGRGVVVGSVVGRAVGRGAGPQDTRSAPKSGPPPWLRFPRENPHGGWKLFTTLTVMIS